MCTELKKILTPTLLTSVHNLQYPWPKSSNLDFSAVGYHLHTGEHDDDEAWKATGLLELAIEPILAMGNDNIPDDLLQFLPPPDSPDFPLFCVGLILLFDQAPSHVIDVAEQPQAKRYFMPLALRLCQQCLNLPADVRPWRLQRWLDNGWSFEHAVARQFFQYTPFLHSSDIDNQAMQHGLIENLRVAVETEVGIIDPSRILAGSDAHDMAMFRKVHIAGPPQGEDIKMEDYVFWLARKANCLLTMQRHKNVQRVQLVKGQKESTSYKP